MDLKTLCRGVPRHDPSLLSIPLLQSILGHRLFADRRGLKLGHDPRGVGPGTRESHWNYEQIIKLCDYRTECKLRVVWLDNRHKIVVDFLIQLYYFATSSE
jgi:hypothetical protein